MSKNRKDKIRIGDICEFKDVNDFFSFTRENSYCDQIPMGKAKGFILLNFVNIKINDFSMKVLILKKQRRYVEVFYKGRRKSWIAVYSCYLLGGGRNQFLTWLVPSKYIRHATFEPL